MKTDDKKLSDAIDSLTRVVQDAESNGSGADAPWAKDYRIILEYFHASAEVVEEVKRVANERGIKSTEAKMCQQWARNLLKSARIDR